MKKSLRLCEKVKKFKKKEEKIFSWKKQNQFSQNQFSQKHPPTLTRRQPGKVRQQQYVIHKRYTDDVETPSTSAINITRTNDEVELPKVAENNVSIMEIKQGCAVTFTPSRPGVKRKQVYIFSPDAIIFSASGFKIIDSSIFLELLFSLRFSFCSDET